MQRLMISVLLIFLVIAPNVMACPADGSCRPLATWHETNWLEINVSSPNDDYEARWTFHMDTTKNDVAIEKSEYYDGDREFGTVAVVGGRMMATKGLSLKAGYEIDAVDGPVLTMQLLLRLVAIVLPDGPADITGQSDINHTEKNEEIRVSTPSASGVYGTPWTAKGSMKKEASGEVFYDIHFQSLIRDGEHYRVHITGSLANTNLIPLPDEKSLKGWKIYSIGPYKREYQDSTVYDYGAQPISDTFETVSGLREEIGNRGNTGK